MNQVQLDAGEIKDFLNYIIDNNRFLQEVGKPPVSVEIQGESGLGKTTIALDVAKERSLHLVKLNLAQIEELGDLVGFPVRQFELCREEGPDDVFDPIPAEPQYEMKLVEKLLPTGQTIKVREKVAIEMAITEQPASNITADCIWVDETAVEQYTKRGYNFSGRKRMSYCPPEWIAGKEGGGLLLIDDWNRAKKNLLN